MLGPSLILCTALHYVNKDIFIVEILGLLGGILIILMMCYVVKKYPQYDLCNVIVLLFGKFFGLLVIFILFVNLLMVALLTEYHIDNLITGMVMTDTPKWVIILSFVLVTAYVVRLGFNTVAITAELIVPIVITILILLYIVMGFNLTDLNNLYPVFTEKASDLIKATIVTIAFPYADIAALFFIMPLLNNKVNIYKNASTGVLISGSLLFCRAELIVGGLDKKMSRDLNFPLFELMRLISISNIFERLEILILWLFFFSSFIKMAILIYAICKIVQYVFKLDDYKKIVFSISLFLVPLGTNLINNLIESKYIYLIFILITKLPLIIIIILIFILSIFKNTTKYKI